MSQLTETAHYTRPSRVPEELERHVVGLTIARMRFERGTLSEWAEGEAPETVSDLLGIRRAAEAGRAVARTLLAIVAMVTLARAL
jgi:hypothetical protein